MKTRIIGLVGKKRAGKDTVFKIIEKKHKNVERFAFADKLKDACKVIFDFDDNQLHRDSKELNDRRWNNRSPREILQFVGTDLLREGLRKKGISESIWTQGLINRFFQLNSRSLVTKTIIVTDCRFQDEIDAIKKMGGFIVKINKGYDKNSKFSKEDNHISESGIDSLNYIDFTIQNTGSISMLANETDIIFKNINELYHKKENVSKSLY